MLDPTQEALLKERCFLVNENDHIIGESSKKDCHLIQKNGDIKLHRAFSVFLFNSKGELLIQKRAATKITYPNRYTNSCCSHPLADYNETDLIGVKKAVQRRLNYELGINDEDVPLDSINYLTRIHYKDPGDGTYGEHEIDYIFFIQLDVNLKFNANEVSEVEYLSKENLENFANSNTLTPWFDLIYRNGFLIDWWNNLNNLNASVEPTNDCIIKLF